MKNMDMDGLFKRYLLNRLRNESPEAIEEILPDIYLEWLNAPNDALGSVSPGAYFRGADAKELIGFLGESIQAGKKPSDPLLDAIVDNKDAEPLLLDLLKGSKGIEGERGSALRREAADLLNQMGSVRALPIYIEILGSRSRTDEIAHTVADAITALGEVAKEPLLTAVQIAEDDAAACMLDILCDLSPDERTYQFLITRFNETQVKENYAKLLERYGDERAIKSLSAALRGEGYFNYIAIRNAIEALGGIVDYEPDFSGDSDYEKMKQFKGE